MTVCVCVVESVCVVTTSFSAFLSHTSLPSLLLYNTFYLSPNIHEVILILTRHFLSHFLTSLCTVLYHTVRTINRWNRPVCSSTKWTRSSPLCLSPFAPCLTRRYAMLCCVYVIYVYCGVLYFTVITFIYYTILTFSSYLLSPALLVPSGHFPPYTHAQAAKMGMKECVNHNLFLEYPGKHTHTHAHTYTCIYTHVHIHPYIHTHKHIHPYVHTFPNTTFIQIYVLITSRCVKR